MEQEYVLDKEHWTLSAKVTFYDFLSQLHLKLYYGGPQVVPLSLYAGFREEVEMFRSEMIQELMAEHNIFRDYPMHKFNDDYRMFTFYLGISEREFENEQTR